MRNCLRDLTPEAIRRCGDLIRATGQLPQRALCHLGADPQAARYWLWVGRQGAAAGLAGWWDGERAVGDLRVLLHRECEAALAEVEAGASRRVAESPDWRAAARLLEAIERRSWVPAREPEAPAQEPAPADDATLEAALAELEARAAEDPALRERLGRIAK